MEEEKWIKREGGKGGGEGRRKEEEEGNDFDDVIFLTHLFLLHSKQ